MMLGIKQEISTQEQHRLIKFGRMFLVVFTLAFFSCQKNDQDNTPDVIPNDSLQSLILNDFSNKVVLANYQDLEYKMSAFYSAVSTLDTNSSQADLMAAQTAWKEVRGAWEMSEAFLFGPVSTENIDPSSDTWPVDYVSLDSLLQAGQAFTQTYLNTLGDELKGYHPAEYILWGEDGQKQATDLTMRECEYLVALVADLNLKSTALTLSWDPSSTNNYSDQMINAGNTSSLYSSQRAAFEEIIGAMAGICEEVANAKIKDPFTQQDPSLEESPFSQNSLTDFKNNILGVKNVYFGKYQQDGYGLHDFVHYNNAALHAKIASQIENALSSFNGITKPFGQAIISEPAQVQHMIDQINILKTTLEEELFPFVQQTITN